MCFSAPVSFAAASLLGGIGAFSVHGARPGYRAFAAVPLLFAAQQVSEGALWLVLNDAPFGKASHPVSQVFLFFALFVWPSYLPASLAIAEAKEERRRALWALSAVGTLLGAYLMGCSLMRPSYACIAYDNLYYGVQVDGALKPVAPFFYVAIILGSLVISSVRGTNVLASAALASFAVAGIVYRVGFASVWCFFAAVLSGLIALIARTTPLSRSYSEQVGSPTKPVL